MTFDPAEAQQHILAIMTAAGSLATLVQAAAGPPQRPLDGAEDASFRQHYTVLRTELANLGLVIGATESTTDFQAFFTGIADALVHAQRALDVHTAEYLADVRQKPHILPSVFRIPSLTADFKFALEKLSHEQMNVVFYSQGEQAKYLNQQSVHFEVVAAPPPPGALDAPGAPWSGAPLLSPTDRQRVFDVMALAVGGADFPAGEGKKLKEVLLGDRDAVLIVPAPADREYFVTVAQGADPKDFGVWHVALATASFTPIYGYTRKTIDTEGPGMQALHDALVVACDAQRQLLRQVAGG